MIVRRLNYSRICGYNYSGIWVRQNTRIAQKNSEIAGKPLEKGHDGANTATGAPRTSETAPGDGVGEEMRADTFVVEDTEVKKDYNTGSGWMGAIKGVVDKVKEVTGVSKPDERLSK